MRIWALGWNNFQNDRSGAGGKQSLMRSAAQVKGAELSAVQLREPRAGGCRAKSHLWHGPCQGLVLYFKGQPVSSIPHLLSHDLAANVAGIFVLKKRSRRNSASGALKETKWKTDLHYFKEQWNTYIVARLKTGYKVRFSSRDSKEYQEGDYGLLANEQHVWREEIWCSQEVFSPLPLQILLISTGDRVHSDLRADFNLMSNLLPFDMPA